MVTKTYMKVNFEAFFIGTELQKCEQTKLSVKSAPAGCLAQKKLYERGSVMLP